jgi:hypothetical protein
MMSTNLVSTIMQSLSQEAIGKIASSLGLDQAAALRAISAGIPGILAGLANAASTPEGAQRLSSTVSSVEVTPGHGIAGNLPGGNTQNIAEGGLNILSSLIGGSSLATLSAVIGQFAGFGQGTAKRLLGLLAPLVLGILRREQVAGGLDSRGLAALLSSQRENIESALPAGVSRNLQSAGTRAVNQPAAAATAAPRPFRRQALASDDRTSSRSWTYWLLPALIAAGVAVYLLPPREDSTTAQAPAPVPAQDLAQVRPAPQPAVQPPVLAAAPVLAPSAAALENDIVANIGRLRSSLQNIKDTGSVQGSLNELRDISAQFGRLKALAQQLPQEARKTLAAAVAARVPDLNGLIDRLGNDVNAGGDAKPAMDTLKSELLSISKV